MKGGITGRLQEKQSFVNLVKLLIECQRLFSIK